MEWLKASYKSHTVLSIFFMAITPSGQVTFLSKLFSGGISYRDIVEQCGFLDLIEPNANMADCGFKIQRDLLLKKKAYLNLPAFSGGTTLAAQAVTKSRKVASVRIHVERGMKIEKLPYSY